MADRFLKGIRTQHWFGLVMAALDECGITDFEFSPPRGRGHPKLIAHLNGKTMKSPVPSTERGGGDHKYLVRRVRRFAEEAREAA